MATGTAVGSVRVDGAELYWEQCGTGPDVVLLNPGWMDLRVWAPNVPGLVEHGLRVTCFDTRGVGRRSSAPGQPWDAVADLLAVLDATGVERAALLGASDGGRLALDVAVAFPERVSGLIIAGTAISESPGPDADPKAAAAHVAALDDLLAALAPRQRAADAGDLRAAFAADLAVWAPTLGEAERERLIAICLDSVNPFAPDRVWPRPPGTAGIDRLGEITAPTLVLVGEHDVRLTQLTARRIATGVPNAQLVVVPGADHLLYAGAPKEFNRIAGEFCRRVYGLD